MSRKKFKSRWMIKEFLKVLKLKPQWTCKYIIDAINKIYTILLENRVSYKFKYQAHRLIYGEDHNSMFTRHLSPMNNSNLEFCVKIS